MAIARFKKVCLDAVDPMRLGPFWADILDLRWEPADWGEGGLYGPEPQCRVWVNKVDEPKTVKHRVHLDMYAVSLAGLQALGSQVDVPEGDDRTWTVMTDLEDGEYCAFLRNELPANRLHGLVVDCVDPRAQARWWGEVYGAMVIDNERGHSTIENVPDMPILTMDFCPVPEPKTAKNRIHWDVAVSDLDRMVDMGATVLRWKGDDGIAWHVLADPEGNEFCAFDA
ncbi:MAG: hypothetical protein GEV10_31285 [Streptosporangiales bacterium]|nr:hypothetical protein [Streptosporangiales bacterium]